MILTFLSRGRRAPKWLLRRSHPGGQSGFALIEVMISALLVGFIAIATFNGFDAVNRVTADQRFHDQAAVLAAQSQELLRSDPASALDELQNTPHTYTQTLGKETFTITQEAVPINEVKQSAGCSATSSEPSVNQDGDYIRITSQVRWPQLGSTRPAVSQSSLITPPDGSGLEVDVTNGGVPEQAVPGVTASVARVQSETEGLPKSEAEAVTGENGCVVFGAIPATKVDVEAYKIGDVTPAGAFTAKADEILITPNRTTRDEVTLAHAGAITAEFIYKGFTEYNSKPVTGDTFVVENELMRLPPEFELGSTQIAYNGEGLYEAQTGTYKPEATTPIDATDYPSGDLFPFTSSWAVYAGDCSADNPVKVTEKEAEKVSSSSALVEPGVITKVKVPMSYVAPVVYKGTFASPEGEPIKNGEYEVKITNTGCASSPTPNNASALNVAHIQKLKEGKLQYPFQPFGEYKLCLYSPLNNNRTYTINYTNKTPAGSTPTIYLGQKSSEKESKEVTVAEGQKKC
jgi:Tfp pilus assembly protein PilV